MAGSPSKSSSAAFKGGAQLSSFVRLQDDERFEREYYISHTSKRRFPLPVLVLFGVAVLLVVGALAQFFTRFSNPIIAFLMLASGVILIIYFLVRRLKVSHGYATVTNRRLIYYEFNDHPHEYYQHVESLHLVDITGLAFRTDRSLLKKSFSMSIWTSRKAISVGARSFLGFLKVLGRKDILEPGPDALQFIQDISGAIAGRKFAVAPASQTPPPVSAAPKSRGAPPQASADPPAGASQDTSQRPFVIATCANCGARVVPGADGLCPSCRSPMEDSAQ